MTLVGPGGVGKTRLAIRSSTALGRGFRNGAWLVQLGEVQGPELVANAVMAALDLRSQAATDPLVVVLSHLRDKELLLVLDNCEHLVEAVARLVNEVIAAASGVRVIATSREPLSVLAEHVVLVPPLELPPAPPDVALDQLRQNEAVLLFTERAAAASGTFELTVSNQLAVAELCRRLDGLPLAIELAAVRTRVIAPEQILERLADRFGLLAGGTRAALPRHQTLRTTIDWSHDLLTPAERTLMRRLCQSTLRQVLQNTESTLRQYALRERAVALGWPLKRVVVIDTDQGQTGATSDREGFQKLVAPVGLGEVGIVLGLEVSRLARNNADWQRLLEICALTDTLILDEDGLYNPGLFNDRLLLGLKGTVFSSSLVHHSAA